MKRRYFALILPFTLLSLHGFADQQSPTAPQSQGDVSFVSGGVGAEEREAMQAARDDYNLKLLFAVKGSGEYLGDVKVDITDSKGDTVLETVSDGPQLFVALKPGRYRVSVESGGQTVSKTATVGNKRAASLVFALPAE